MGHLTLYIQRILQVMILDFLDDAFDQKDHFIKLDRDLSNIGLMFPNINNDGAIFEVFQWETILNTYRNPLSPELMVVELC